jgi:hypothetical protein
MRETSGLEERVTVLRRRVWSDLFAAVTFTLLLAVIVGWGLWGAWGAERSFRWLIPGAFVFALLCVPSWLRWAKNRARLRVLATSGGDAQSVA